MDGQVVVQEVDGTRYIEVEGVRYESAELPEEGTTVETFPFTWVGDVPGVDVTWIADTPSGMSSARLRAS